MRVLITALLAASMVHVLTVPARPELLINEATTGAPSDWVEVYLKSGENESMDISGLVVTMYYGSSEKLADGPVTLFSFDRPETAYDDRFAVIHLTEPGGTDETDGRGDLNGNGIRDIYCGNYSGSLWNTDGVIAIDTDDDPSNGAIDFAAYSNRDGSPNSSTVSYITSASATGQWAIGTEGPGGSCVYIGPDGLKPYMSISRRDGPDTNSMEDFAVTRFQTPGRMNIFSTKTKKHGLFRVMKKKISIMRPRAGASCPVPVFINRTCSLKFRVFTTNGIMIYRAGLVRDMYPGQGELHWKMGRVPAGLYLGRIEAVSPDGLSETRTVYFIVGR